MIVAVAGVNSKRCAFQLEFGVVYSCIEDKMYTGRKGKGAFCDGEKLEVSDVKGTSRENVSVCPSVWLSGKETDDRFLMFLQRRDMKRVSAVRPSVC